MKLFKKILMAAVIATATMTAAQASPINVGGVVWDPDASNIGDSDFHARYSFNQYFSTASDSVANSTNAAADYTKAINPNTVGPTDVLQGVGIITSFNGVDYNAGIASSFCPGCELTFTFGGFAINNVGSFSGGWLRIYVDSTPEFHIATSPAADAADGNLFLELTARTSDFTPSAGFSSGALFTYFDVTGGIAAGNFNTNTQKFGTDLLSSASAQFNNPAPYQFIATSTGEISGNTIPEPTTVFLMGAALLGLAMTRRKKQI